METRGRDPIIFSATLAILDALTGGFNDEVTGVVKAETLREIARRFKVSKTADILLDEIRMVFEKLSEEDAELHPAELQVLSAYTYSWILASSGDVEKSYHLTLEWLYKFRLTEKRSIEILGEVKTLVDSVFPGIVEVVEEVFNRLLGEHYN